MIPMPNSPLPKPRAAAKMEVDASSLRHSVAKTKAIILLGGTKDETQFRPLSFSGPKALFPVAGIPMIYHLMKACAQVEGMAEIILIGVFPENQFAAFVAQAERTLNIPVRYLKEFKPLGTGGGIYFFRVRHAHALLVACRVSSAVCLRARRRLAAAAGLLMRNQEGLGVCVCSVVFLTGGRPQLTRTSAARNPCLPHLPPGASRT